MPVRRHRLPSAKHNVGRRTGVDILKDKKVRRITGGFENFDDYFSDKEDVLHVSESDSSASTEAFVKAADSKEPNKITEHETASTSLEDHSARTAGRRLQKSESLHKSPLKQKGPSEVAPLLADEDSTGSTTEPEVSANVDPNKCRTRLSFNDSVEKHNAEAKVSPNKNNPSSPFIILSPVTNSRNSSVKRTPKKTDSRSTPSKTVKEYTFVNGAASESTTSEDDDDGQLFAPFRVSFAIRSTPQESGRGKAEACKTPRKSIFPSFPLDNNDEKEAKEVLNDAKRLDSNTEDVGAAEPLRQQRISPTKQTRSKEGQKPLKNEVIRQRESPKASPKRKTRRSLFDSMSNTDTAISKRATSSPTKVSASGKKLQARREIVPSSDTEEEAQAHRKAEKIVVPEPKQTVVEQRILTRSHDSKHVEEVQHSKPSKTSTDHCATVPLKPSKEVPRGSPSKTSSKVDVLQPVSTKRASTSDESEVEPEACPTSPKVSRTPSPVLEVNVDPMPSKRSQPKRLTLVVHKRKLGVELETKTRSGVTQKPSPKRPHEENGLRRSKRQRLPVLEHWRNERPIYRRGPMGWSIVDVDPGFEPEDWYLPLIKAERPKNHNAVAKKPKVKLGRPKLALNNPVAGNVFKDANGNEMSDVMVVDPRTEEEVYIECVKVKESYMYYNMDGNLADNGDPVVITKAIQQKVFSSGALILKPGKEKGTHILQKDTMVFWILTGKVEVTIHETTVILGPSDTFFVPQGNTYNIRNCGNSVAELAFFQHLG